MIMLSPSKHVVLEFNIVRLPELVEVGMTIANTRRSGQVDFFTVLVSNASLNVHKA
jgi:hypothetical protein